MQNLDYVQFQGVQIPCLIENDTIWVAIKPIAEAIGLNTESVVRELKNDEILGGVHTIQYVRDASNRQNSMVCLPIQYVNGWLFGIQTGKVKEEVRPVLLQYKRECYEVLYRHFFAKHSVIEKNIKEMHALMSERERVGNHIKHLTTQLKAIEKAIANLQMDNFTQLKLEFPNELLLEKGGENV